MPSRTRTIASARREDIVSVVKVHQEAFPGFFLTILGSRFLQTMYHAFLVNQNGIFIVANDKHQVVGFAVGQLHGATKDRSLALRFLPKFITSSILGIIRHPIKIGGRLVTRFFTTGGQPDISSDAAILRSIGVLPSARGTGVSDSLLEEFERQAFTRGAKQIALTTDAVDNQRAISFYQKNGYKVEQEFRQDKKRLMLLMLKSKHEESHR